MFIQTNDRIVNLKNVSNINVLDDYKRVVFNMNYNVEIKKRNDYVFISDYVYWDLLSSTQLNESLSSILNSTFFKDNFIIHNNQFVNMNEISSIKFSDKKLRIIINLSHPVTYTDYNGIQSITSEFVYFNFNDVSEYNEFAEKLKLRLGA
jgi:hypothetical protein